MTDKEMSKLAAMIGAAVNNAKTSDSFEIFGDAKEILSLDYVLVYLQRNFPQFVVNAVRPFGFVIGSNNNAEGIPSELEMNNTLFFGKLQICVNPNTTQMVSEQIDLRYHSYLSQVAYWKHITRLVDAENYIYEASESMELFDKIELTRESTAYDVYVSFVGYKLQYD